MVDAPRHRPIPWLWLNLIACAIWIVVPSCREAAAGQTCVGNLHAVAMGTLIYAVDHDDRLPIARNWAAAALPYTRGTGQFRCPNLEEHQPAAYGHAFVVGLSGGDLRTREDFGKDALLFDSSKLGWSVAAGGQELARDRNSNAAFLDGSVRAAKSEDIPTGRY